MNYSDNHIFYVNYLLEKNFSIDNLEALVVLASSKEDVLNYFQDKKLIQCLSFFDIKQTHKEILNAQIHPKKYRTLPSSFLNKILGHFQPYMVMFQVINTNEPRSEFTIVRANSKSDIELWAKTQTNKYIACVSLEDMAHKVENLEQYAQGLLPAHVRLNNL